MEEAVTRNPARPSATWGISAHVGPKIIIGKSAQICCVAVLRSCNSAQISNPAPLDFLFDCSCERKLVLADAPCYGLCSSRLGLMVAQSVIPSLDQSRDWNREYSGRCLGMAGPQWAALDPYLASAMGTSCDGAFSRSAVMLLPTVRFARDQLAAGFSIVLSVDKLGTRVCQSVSRW